MIERSPIRRLTSVFKTVVHESGSFFRIPAFRLSAPNVQPVVFTLVELAMTVTVLTILTMGVIPLVRCLFAVQKSSNFENP